MLFLNGPRQTTPITPQLQLTETVRNDVNLKKQSLKLNKIPNSQSYTLEFDFDAATDCTLSIWYLAEEILDTATNNTIRFETTYQIQPKTRQFRKGLGQHFVQPLDEGFNASMVQNRGLMYYHQGSHHFPVVLMLQTCDANPARVQSQSTFATFKSQSDGTLSIAVIKQKIQVQGNAYELQEIYGIEQSEESENSKECVICMSSPKDTTVLPCRHMCMCSECAKVLRFQTNKCPICRCAVESLLQIKVNPTSDSAE